MFSLCVLSSSSSEEDESEIICNIFHRWLPNCFETYS